MHPRSRMTASLFTTTLMVSFLVVAAPHLIPCPVDPRTLNDSADPTRKRRRRRIAESEEDGNDGLSEDAKMRIIQDKFSPKRECPIPKPGGLVGQVLGMTKSENAPHEERMSVTKQVERRLQKVRDGGDQ